MKYIACCENLGYKAYEKVCPARGKRYRKYSNPGHFEKVLESKVKTSEGRKRGKDRRVRQLGVGVDENDVVNMLLVVWVVHITQTMADFCEDRWSSSYHNYYFWC